MNLKRKLSLGLAAALALGCGAFAEPADLQAQLDEANARIAELEAQVEKYKPYYENQIVAEYGEDGIIWKEDADAEYKAASEAYSQYGLNIEDYADGIKQDILETLVRNAILDAKAAELGLDQLDDEARANLEAEAAENFETYIETYKGYFADEDAEEDAAREQTIAAMESYGLTKDALLEQMLESYVDEQLHAHITKDVAVTDEDIQAEYDAMVAEDEEAYADDDMAYNNARNSGATIAWNPEGYRTVKHVLIEFDEDQSAKYTELQTKLDALKDEKDAVENPVVEDGAEGAEGDEAEAEATPEATPEPTPEPRSLDEIEADIAGVTAEIEALHTELLPQAQQVIDEFEAGADFDSLIEKYNADPGMNNEPTATQGYAVSADSTVWDPAFTEGAMSIAEVGQISAPVYGSLGIHIIYYLSDITPGAVPFEDIADAVADRALEDKVSETYDALVSSWVEEAAPVYHADRF
jgi:hypothetical protein